MLPLDDYLNFDSLPKVFQQNESFENWVKHVDSSLRGTYGDLRRDIQSPSPIVEWRLVTLYRRHRRGENRLSQLNPDLFVYGASLLELFELELEGATPPGDPLEVKFTENMIIDDPKLRHKSYVLAARLKDFIDYLDDDPEGRLFARNVRLDLKSEINRNIKETYENRPEEFWYSHNGLFVICSSASITGKRIRMTNPSVINGSQTLHSLRGVSRRDPDALVLTRVLEVPNYLETPKQVELSKKFVNDVIFRTNQQNKMYAYDLRANDIQQVNIAKEFMKNKVFYERRRGEWRQRKRLFKNQGMDNTTNVEIAQIMASFDRTIGVAEAKRSKEELFREHYDELFYQPFTEIFLAFKVYRLVKYNLQDMSFRGTTPTLRRHAIFTVAAIFWDSLSASPNFRKLSNSTQNATKLGYSDQATNQFDRLIKEIFSDCWNSWKEANEKDRSLSPNNFFKNDKINKQLRNKIPNKYIRRVTNLNSPVF